MDILFLLTPGFADPDRDGEGLTYFCPDCAFMEGVLHYHPALREQLDIRYVGYPKPRRDIVALVGEARQGCPNLILDPSNHGAASARRFHRVGDRLHTDDPRAIAEYLAERYGIAIAHY